MANYRSVPTKDILLKLHARGVQVVNESEQTLTPDAIEKEVGGKVHLVIPHDALGNRLWGAVDALGHRGITYRFPAEEPETFKKISGSQVAKLWAAKVKVAEKELLFGQGA